MSENVRGGSIEIPVELSQAEQLEDLKERLKVRLYEDPNMELLEEVPHAESGEPYPAPTPEAMAELAEAVEIEEQTADLVATVRDEQSMRIANLATDGVHHFLVNSEGQELCGSCGTPFPCAKWVGEIDPRNAAESAGQPVADEDKARAVAELLGVDLGRARQIVLLSSPSDEQEKGI